MGPLLFPMENPHVAVLSLGSAASISQAHGKFSVTLLTAYSDSFMAVTGYGYSMDVAWI